jgi:hypothetical protein
MPNQPIGYVEPDDGEKLALGIADAMNPPEPPPGRLTAGVARSLGAAGVTGGAQLSPTPFTGPGAGTIFTGRGQAPNANSSQGLRGLNST